MKPYLPYQKRIRNLESFKLELTNLLLRMERKWYAIFEGQLSDEEVYLLTIEMKQEKTNLESRYLSTTPLPENKKYLDKAQQKTNNYFRRNYFGGTTNVNP